MPTFFPLLVKLFDLQLCMKCAALISCLAFVTLEDILACRSQTGTGVTNNINYGSVPLKPFPSTCIDVHLPSICPWKKKKKKKESWAEVLEI